MARELVADGGLDNRLSCAQHSLECFAMTVTMFGLRTFGLGRMGGEWVGTVYWFRFKIIST